MALFRSQAPSDLQVRLLSFSSSTRAVAKGATVFREGERSHGCYLVKSGRLRLFVAGERSRPILETEVADGSVIGLPAAVNGNRYSMSCLALAGSELVYLTRSDLKALMSSDTATAIMLLDLLSDEVQQLRKVIAKTPARVSRGRTHQSARG